VLPLSHAALAYLWYAGVVALGRRRLPTGLALAPLLVASQLPDLIDKPLAYAGLVPSGRSVAHSLLALAAVALVTTLLCRRLARTTADPRTVRRLAQTPLAVAVGYATHLAGDAYGSVRAGAYADVGFLLYPFVAAPVSPKDAVAPWVRLRRIYLGGQGSEFVALVVAAAVVCLLAHAWAYWRRRRLTARY
jgi:Predicted membrane-bound metal-dependent hydrolase (DUF457).